LVIDNCSLILLGVEMNPELTQLVTKAAAVFKSAGAQEVYLFGSAARGALRPDSDLDLAVTGLRPELFFATLGQAEDVIRRRLDVIDLDRDTPFTRYLKRKGVLHRVA
jgi:predicted nucleotidyltransferase